MPAEEKYKNPIYTRWKEISFLKELCSNTGKQNTKVTDMLPQCYDTMCEALSGLYKLGFTYDFNLITKETYNHTNHLPIQDFVIVRILRFEDNSDPAESAILYAIASNIHQMRGTLVNGYGIYADPLANRFINSIRLQRNAS